MSDDHDLYTDYALQIFSSYVSEDIQSMEYILESFKNDNKNADELFFPGVIYGLLYHLSNVFYATAINTNQTVEQLLHNYAMEYAIERERLLENPLLNVHKAREVLDKILAEIKMLEQSLNNEE